MGVLKKRLLVRDESARVTDGVESWGQNKHDA